ncbi:hypothetical protein Bca52824_072784 [Brassica carinata]|uniref:C2H2-type domain-containing protein n=1 Tax=Brassica carinata TaxID=52824 RepID=A0A8X7QBU4_BRACI|nr:hypothetical protein Bca52824_072784 [Brassica carinata]
MALEALSSPRLASPIPPVFQDSSRFHGVEQWTKGKRSKRSRFDFNHHNLTEEEDLAFLMLLARDGNRQLLPLPPVTVVAEKSSLSYKCSVCDKSFSSYRALRRTQSQPPRTFSDLSEVVSFRPSSRRTQRCHWGIACLTLKAGSTSHVSSSHRGFDLNIPIPEFSTVRRRRSDEPYAGEEARLDFLEKLN